ncbi:hypothetical protein HWI79_180 [Cryptosporidium felis]|nr:hypothetical protein HWI79_180 [Cryptosporidium felis]
MRLSLLTVVLAINAVLIKSSKFLSSYGCYTLIGNFPRLSALPRSITPISTHDSNSEEVSIVCISLVKGAEFKCNREVGDFVDLTTNTHGLSLVLPKLEMQSGLYGSSLESVVISSCKRAKILLLSPSNQKLMLLQPFAVFGCIDVIKQYTSIPQISTDQSRSLQPKIDYSSLGVGIPFSKRPYECRFDSPTFAKDGSIINYKKKQVYWTCFSRVEELLVFNLSGGVSVSEKILLALVDDMKSCSNKISIKSPCNGITLEKKQGILTKNTVFLRIECEEENLPKLLDTSELESKCAKLRKP